MECDKYHQDDHSRSQYQSVAVAENEYPADMAVAAAKKALDHAETSGDTLDFLTYTSIHRHGQPQLWCPASYVQRELQANNALPFALSQGCNSQMLTVDLYSKIMNSEKPMSALLVAADQFASSRFDRWNSDYGLLYGDVAAALVLSNQRGFARILQIETVTDPFLEEMHRDDVPYTEQSETYKDAHYSARFTKKKFIEKHGKDIIMECTLLALTLLKKKMQDAFESHRVKYIAFPNLGKQILESSYYPHFKEAEKKSLWSYGSTIGHLGSADCAASLAYLVEMNLLMKGDQVFLLGAGAGFTWTGIVIEIV